MKITTLTTSLVTAAGLVASGLLVAATPAAAAASQPPLQLPFRCGEVWNGEASKSPRHKDGDEIDFNWGNTTHADRGKPVLAAAAGKVTTSAHQGSRNGYGNLVTIDHGGGWVTFYAHLDQRAVAQGDTVRQGEQIGTVGDTTRPGGSTTPHLHFEVRNGPRQRDIQPAVFDGTPFDYPSDSVRSRNNCDGTKPDDKSPQRYPVRATLDGRTAKDMANHAAPDRYRKGTQVTIVCQDSGPATYHGSKIWDLTSDGLWVVDYYVGTGHTGFSPDLPRCELPKAYKATETLNGWKQKSLKGPARENLYRKGSDVQVVCQAHGEVNYRGSTIWNRTVDNVWVADFYLDTDTNGFVPGLPRCDTDKPNRGTDEPGDGGARKSPADLHASTRGLEFIAEKEGFQPAPYGDPGGRCTIGYGHLIAGDRGCTDADHAKWGRLTKSQAWELLVKDAADKAAALRNLIPDTPLRQREFDALLSLVFNIGAGGDGGPKGTKLHDALLAEPPQYARVPELLQAFVNDSGNPVCGLHLRRLEEGRIFSQGAYTWRASEDSCPPGYAK